MTVLYFQTLNYVLPHHPRFFAFWNYYLHNWPELLVSYALFLLATSPPFSSSASAVTPGLLQKSVLFCFWHFLSFINVYFHLGFCCLGSCWVETVDGYSGCVSFWWPLLELGWRLFEGVDGCCAPCIRLLCSLCHGNYVQEKTSSLQEKKSMTHQINLFFITGKNGILANHGKKSQ